MGSLGAPALVLDPTKVSQELRDLVRALQEADEILTAAVAAFDAEYELYREWQEQNPAPDGKSRRAMRRWDLRQDRYIERSNFFSARAAQVEAIRVHEAARMAIAQYRARDVNELVHMACLVTVLEDDSKHGIERAFIARSVAYDLARLGTGGGISA